MDEAGTSRSGARRPVGSGGGGSASSLRAVITNPVAFAEQCELSALRAGDAEKRAIMLGANSLQSINFELFECRMDIEDMLAVLAFLKLPS